MNFGGNHATFEELPEVGNFFMNTLMESYKTAKVEITRNGPTDLEPRILYMPISMDSLMGIVPVFREGLIDPPTGLGLALLAARERFGPPAMAIFMSEAYMKVYDVDHGREELEKEMETHQRGDWVGDPDASECLTIHLAHLMPDGVGVRYLFANIPFRYEDGSVTFGDTVLVDSQDPETETGEGAMYDVMMRSFTVTNN